MKKIADDIERAIDEHALLIQAMDIQEFERKPSPTKWSKKEILGHLVDSAQNNLRRFVVGQYENNPKISYDQDKWVNLQQYQQCSRGDVVQLWVTLNKHLCHVLLTMDPANAEKTCDTGKNAIELHSLKFLAEDYVQHMNHHLKQITG